MTNLYKHITKHFYVELVEKKGTICITKRLDDNEVVSVPQLALEKWYKAVDAEEAARVLPKYNRSVAVEATEEEAQAVVEEVAQVAEEITEEPVAEEVVEEVVEPEVVVAEPQEEPAVEEPQEVTQEEEPKPVAKAPVKKEAKPKPTKVAQIPEDAKHIRLLVEGVEFEAVEYLATEKTFKTEAIIYHNDQQFRLGTVFSTETQKAFSSYYFIDNRVGDLKSIQRKGIASASKVLEEYLPYELNLLQDIMAEARNLANYKEEQE